MANGTGATDPWASYMAAVALAPSSVDYVEAVLAQTPQGAQVRGRELVHLGSGMPPNFDDVMRLLHALADAGVLVRHHGDAFEVDNAALDRTRGQRLGIRQAVQWMKSTQEKQVPALLLGAPADTGQQLSIPIERTFRHLQTAVRTVITEAAHDLILASPFWDTDVVANLAPLLEHRLTARARVRVLTRIPTPGTASAEALARLAALEVGKHRVEILTLDEPSPSDPFGKRTFHFKTACADGDQAYVGSANFNTAGFASRWELGLLLRGRMARTVCAFVDSLCATAQRYVQK